MNGEMYQISCITAAAKHALQNKTDILYIPEKYINKIKFRFLFLKRILKMKSPVFYNLSDWYAHNVKNGLKDIKLVMPIFVGHREILGFSNTTKASIACFYENYAVKYFTAYWKFDSAKQVWNVYYTENTWSKAPIEKLYFSNNKDSFLKVLTEIKALAVQLECNFFADVFDSAQNILLGSKEYTDTKYNFSLPIIPEENLHLFEAASMADVFGAMGSWNDSPRYIAHEKGLDTEYEELSDKLLENIRHAILYAINEW